MNKRTRNALIAALVLVLCCFGASVRNPFASDDAGSNAIIDVLGRFAAKGTAVPDSAIRASPAPCRTGPDTFQFTGSCTLTVAEGGTGLRNLVLTSSRAMTVSSTVPRKDFTVTDDVDAGEQVKVAIDERGGAVGLTCAPLQTCVVTRGEGS
jgi:Flp pilus assembly protein TadG